MAERIEIGGVLGWRPESDFEMCQCGLGPKGEREP